MEAELGSYACPCTNVRIDLEKVEITSNIINKNSDQNDDEKENQSTHSSSSKNNFHEKNVLKNDVLVPRSKASIKFNISQPLLTARTILPPSSNSQGQSSLTALICLNCNKTVYSVNKVQQSTNSRSIGFAANNSSSGRTATDSPSPVRSNANSTGEQDTILRPANGVGMMWIMSGCLFGSEMINSILSKENYSRAYGMVIAQINNNEKENTSATSSTPLKTTTTRLRSDSDVQRSLSPRRGLPLASTGKRTTSPSPVRRRRAQPLAVEEEEQGDDLDTLHLLETLLPHIPSSVVQDVPHINGNEGSLLRRNLANSTPKSMDKSNSSQKQLESRLDHIAVLRLREERDKAQKEIYAILKQKSLQINQLEKQLRNEARQLSKKYTSNSSSLSDQMKQQQQQQHQKNSGANAEDDLELSNTDEIGNESTSPLFIRRRPLVPMALEKSISQDSDPSRRMTQIPGSIGASSMREGSGSSISNQMNVGSNSQTTPFIGSYLSASFAMRGRDLPNQPEPVQRTKEEEEDWFAHKKRLRERYPNADHSALPSAVNSDDEGAVQVKSRSRRNSTGDETEEEEEERGRGRGRANERGGGGNNNKTPTPPQKKNDRSNQVEIPVKGGEITKENNEDLSQTLPTTKRGALKSSGSNGTTNVNVMQDKTGPAGEKKVAFASTTEEVLLAPRQNEKSNERTREPIEQSDPVFEIDEDIEADDLAANSSDIVLDPRANAISESTKEIVQSKLQEDLFLGEGNTKNENDRGFKASTSIVDSLPVVGSFAAMAESESRRGSFASGSKPNVSGKDDKSLMEEDEENFDPASLRFDGRMIYTADFSDNLTRPNTSSFKDRALVEEGGGGGGSRSVNLPVGKSIGTIAAQQALLAGFPADNLQRSAIGFRIMVGEAEARLSGLLAPDAPSHRDLWSNRKRKGLSTLKYKLEGLTEEEDDEFENDEIEEKKENKKVNESAKPIPSESSQNSGALDDLVLARSVPINTRGNFTGRSFSTIHRDATSGFDLEPKTSLPYQEKMLTPSLRKATRHLRTPGSTSLQRKSSLGTISDTSEKPGSTDAGSVQDIVPGKPAFSRENSKTNIKAPIPIKAGGIASPSKNSSSRNTMDLKYPIPSSVTKGFDIEKRTPTLPSVARIAAAESAQSSPILGSSSSTNRSNRVRSPRPPYIAPPLPSSMELRLTPDDTNRPNPLKLPLATQPDEIDEEEEEKDIENVLQFMHILQRLKVNKRTGWYHHRIKHPESIADHMYRMAMLSMLLSDTDLDIGKCVQLCLVHDLAEALVGDITPLDNVDKDEKLQREKDAIDYLVNDLLAGSKVSKRIENLWNEYEDRQTSESKAVKDLDRFELALQGVEYEKEYQTADLQPFYDGSSHLIQHPRIQRWIRILAKERESVWKGTRYEYVQTYPKDQVALTPWAVTGESQSAA